MQMRLDLNDHIEYARCLIEKNPNRIVARQNFTNKKYGLYEKMIDFYGSKDYNLLSYFSREECDEIIAAFPKIIQKEYA